MSNIPSEGMVVVPEQGSPSVSLSLKIERSYRIGSLLRHEEKVFEGK
jgi:hypothetical protein